MTMNESEIGKKHKIESTEVLINFLSNAAPQ